MRFNSKRFELDLSLSGRSVFVRLGRQEFFWHPEEGLVRGTAL